MPKRLNKEQLKCPLCRKDISGLLSYAEIRQWLKRQERSLTLLRMRRRKADRKKAVVFLRRLVMREIGELNISDGGKKLGLAELSRKIIDQIMDSTLKDTPLLTEEEVRQRMAKETEKVIVEYFTRPQKDNPS